MQIAVVLEDEQVEELDSLVPDEFASRAEVVRTAVRTWLAERRAAALDRQYELAYNAEPQSVDEIDSGRLRKDLPSGIWDDLEW